MAQPDSIAEHRAFVRKKVRSAALVLFDGTPVGCEILNISAGGALLRLAAGVAPAMPAMLEIEGYGAYPCEIIWVDGGQVGVEFLEEHGVMADVAMAIAIFEPK